MDSRRVTGGGGIDVLSVTADKKTRGRPPFAYTKTILHAYIGYTRKCHYSIVCTRHRGFAIRTRTTAVTR